MATGFFDSNGIWNYGEDDNIALFSDTLNKLADSTSDAFTADRARISTLEAGSLSGLIPVKPTTVTAVTGTAATNTTGTVSFTGVSKISLDGVFNANYKNYLVVFAATSPSNSAGSATPIVLRNAGADITTNYTWYGRRMTNWVIDDNGSASDSAFRLIDGYSAATKYSYAAVINVLNPFSASHTNITSQASVTGSGKGAFTYSGGHFVDQSVNGFSINGVASTLLLTGTITVYGYNN